MKTLYKSFVGGQASRLVIPGLAFNNECLMLHEVWTLATPPIGSYGSVGEEIETFQSPQYYTQLKADGFKADGFGIMYDYPGGVNKYFNDITKPIINSYCAGLSFNSTSFTGHVMIDIEVAYPATNEGTIWMNLGATNFVAYMNQKYGTNRREAIQLYNGMCAQYYPLVIQYLRKKFPQAKIGLYDTPQSGPHNTWYSSNINQINAIKNLMENDLHWLFTLIDFIMPSLYLYYSLSNTPIAGQTTYVDYHSARDSYFQYALDLKNKLGIQSYPTITPIYDISAASFSGKPVVPQNWNTVEQMLALCGADGAVIWANIYDLSSLINNYNGLKNALPVLNAFRLSGTV